MPSYPATGLVVHRLNLGETDKIITLFTREHGKLSAVAKSARKPNSRLSGATELFTLSRFLLLTNLQAYLALVFAPAGDDLKGKGGKGMGNGNSVEKVTDLLKNLFFRNHAAATIASGIAAGVVGIDFLGAISKSLLG